MTLKKLQYNDTGSFLLRVVTGTDQFKPGASVVAVITISQVNGEYGFFYYQTIIHV